MWLICNHTTFLLVSLEDDDFLKVVCSNVDDGLDEARSLLFKFNLWLYNHVLVEGDYCIEAGMMVYEVSVLGYDWTNANYNSEEHYYYEYITCKQHLLGYVRLDKLEVLLY